MKVTVSENAKQYVLEKIESVYIGFDDNVEVKLDKIVSYDLDLDRAGYSTIELANALDNVEIENHYSKNSHIIYVHIEAKGFLVDSDKDVDIFYDLPCDMKIRRLRINGDINIIQGMFVQLEGIMK